MDPRGEASPRSHGHRRRRSPSRSPSPSQPIGNQAHSPRPPPAHPKDGATGGSPLGEGSPRRPPPPARSRSRKRPRSSSEPPPPPRHAPFGGGFCPTVPRPPPLRRPRRRTGRPGPSGAKGAAPSPRLPSRYFLRSRRWTLFTTPESFSCSSFRSCSGGGGGGGGEAAAPPGRGRDRGAASMAVPLLRRAQPGRGRCEPDATGQRACAALRRAACREIESAAAKLLAGPPALRCCSEHSYKQDRSNTPELIVGTSLVLACSASLAAANLFFEDVHKR